MTLYTHAGARFLPMLTWVTPPLASKQHAFWTPAISDSTVLNVHGGGGLWATAIAAIADRDSTRKALMVASEDPQPLC